MQKLEDFLYDFIGVFIPGFFFLISLWFTTIIFLKIEVFNIIYIWIPFHSVLIENPNYLLIKSFLKQKTLIILSFIIICYISGMILNNISTKLIKILNKIAKIRAINSKYEDEMVYKENKNIEQLVKHKLEQNYRVAWNEVENKNKWIVFYRWACNKTNSKEEISSILILISKIILNRSLFCATILLSIYTIGLMIISISIFLFKDFNQTGEIVIYYIAYIIYIIISLIMSVFFYLNFIDTRRKLCNESILILFKVI